MKKILSFISLAILFLAGCSQEIQPNLPDEKPAVAGTNKFRITVANPNQDIATKSDKSSWESGDVIRVYFKNEGEDYLNVSEGEALILKYDGSDWVIEKSPERTLSSGQYFASYYTTGDKVNASFSQYGEGQYANYNSIIQYDGGGELLTQNWITTENTGDFRIPGLVSYFMEDDEILLSLSLKHHPDALQVVVPGLDDPSDWNIYMPSDTYDSYGRLMPVAMGGLIGVSYYYYSGNIDFGFAGLGTYIQGVETTDGATFFMTNGTYVHRSGLVNTQSKDLDQYRFRIFKKGDDVNAYEYVVDRIANGDGTYQKNLAPNMHIELPAFDGDDPNPVYWKPVKNYSVSTFILYNTTDGDSLEPTLFSAKDRQGNALPYSLGYGPIKGIFDAPVNYIQVYGTAGTMDLSYECDANGSSTLSHFWGIYGSGVSFNSFSKMFKNCKNLITVIMNQMPAYNVASTEQMFYGCESLHTVEFSGQFSSSSLSSMKEMFSGCTTLDTIMKFDYMMSGNPTMAALTNLNSVFKGCESLESIDFFKNCFTNNVTDMGSLFEGCSSLTSVDVLSMNTDKVETMQNMFKGCSSLENLDLVRFNTSKVSNMSGMFESCSSLKSLDMSWMTIAPTTSVTNMFKNTSSLENIKIGSSASAISGDVFSGIANGGVLSYPKGIDCSSWVNALGNYGWTTSERAAAAGYEMVDLGLSVKWASYDLGSSNPFISGDFFAWGETSPKASYTDDNYTYLDDVAELPATADAAVVNWGEGWRMPTSEEAYELVEMCDWEQVSLNFNTTKYWKISGRGAYSDNCIYLPVNQYKVGADLAGIMSYWTSTRYGDMFHAYIISGMYAPGLVNSYRTTGTNIRAVHE